MNNITNKISSATPSVTRRDTLPLLGFGMMRLPESDGKIDRAAAAVMVEKAMTAGCNYFDTAYMYHGGESESAVAELLGKYPRESYYLTSKMPTMRLQETADMERIFNEQLERTQAGYFDFYLMHTLNTQLWETAKRLDLYGFMKEKQAEGKIRHIGFSFHDTPEVLREIASAYPWEIAQIQLNYLDWELYRSREQYEILTELGIPVAIMEPLKGGSLVNLTPAAKAIFETEAPGTSIASWGLRYAASLPNVKIVLSGMSNQEQMEDNIRTFSPMEPLKEEDYELIGKVLAAYRESGAIPCTACKYCQPCPVGVDIPRNIALYNQVKAGGHQFWSKIIYDSLPEEGRAAACVQCGACLEKCPQKIRIPDAMTEIAGMFK